MYLFPFGNKGIGLGEKRQGCLTFSSSWEKAGRVLTAWEDFPASGKSVGIRPDVLS